MPLGGAVGLPPAADALVEASPVGIIALDREGLVTRWNPAAGRIFGWSGREVLGRPVPIVPEEERPTYLANRERVLRGEVIDGVDVRRVRRDGSVVEVRMSTGPVLSDGDIVGSICTLVDIGDHKRTEAELLRSLRRVAAERRRVFELMVRAQEDERQHLADDIHDDAIQTMSSVGIRLESLRRRVADPLRGEVERLQRLVEGAIARLRALVFDVQPAVLERERIAAALGALLARVLGEEQVSVERDIRLEEEPPPEVGIVVYRIVQEAVTNVRKHAGASRVRLVAEPFRGGILVTVADDGAGVPSWVDPESGLPGHRGVRRMRERADSAGGWLRIESAPGRGATVTFWVPIVDPPV